MFKARDRITGDVVALKTMRFALTEDGVPMAILREISLLKQLERFRHPNIVRYFFQNFLMQTRPEGPRERSVTFF